MQRTSIFAWVPEEVLAQIRTHPLLRKMTQADSYVWIFRHFLNSAESRNALRSAPRPDDSHEFALPAEEPEGYFIAYLGGGKVDECPGSTYVNLIFRIVDATESNIVGHSFAVRVPDFPLTRHGGYCKRAFGLQSTDSLAKRLNDIVGRNIQIRRQRDSSGRMYTYFHPLP